MKMHILKFNPTSQGWVGYHIMFHHWIEGIALYCKCLNQNDMLYDEEGGHNNPHTKWADPKTGAGKQEHAKANLDYDFKVDEIQDA